MKYLLTLLFAMPVQAAPIIGEGDPFPGPEWRDLEPVRVKIDPLMHGSTVDREITFNVYYENMLFEPENATKLPTNYADGTKRANAGHLHLYATLLGSEWNTTNVFVGAADNEIEPGVLEYIITFPETGPWMIYAEAQYDDHTPRTRPHPQQIGAWDAIFVNVVPEPGTMALLAIGGALILLRRKR